MPDLVSEPAAPDGAQHSKARGAGTAAAVVPREAECPRSDCRGVASLSSSVFWTLPTLQRGREWSVVPAKHARAREHAESDQKAQRDRGGGTSGAVAPARHPVGPVGDGPAHARRAQPRGQTPRHFHPRPVPRVGTNCTRAGKREALTQLPPPHTQTLLSTGQLCAIRMSPPTVDFFSQQPRAAESHPNGLCQTEMRPEGPAAASPSSGSNSLGVGT